jgi:hypothetical protein
VAEDDQEHEGQQHEDATHQDGEEPDPHQPDPTSGSWLIPTRSPAPEGAGWNQQQPDRGGAGSQWVQPARPGLRPTTPTAPRAKPATDPFTPLSPVPAPAPVSSPFLPVSATPAQVVAPAAAGWSGSRWLADIGAVIALAIELGVFLQLMGSIFVSRSSRIFVGSTLIAEAEGGARFRLLEVFSQASFEQAVIVLVAILLTVSAPTHRRSPLRPAALVGAIFLGLYIAVGATLRAVVLMTFLGTSAALALGTTLSCLAAVPVACGAIVWAAMLLTRDERERKLAAVALADI